MNTFFANLFFIVLLLISNINSVKLKARLRANPLLQIQGTIKYIDNTDIKKDDLNAFNTKITFYNLDSKIGYPATFLQDGYYQVSLTAGKYLRHILSDGFFQSLEVTVIDTVNNSTFSKYQIFLTSNGKKLPVVVKMVTVSGFFSDATTGKVMNDKALTDGDVKISFTNTDTKEVFQGKFLANATYSVYLPVGNYSRIASMDGYSDSESVLKVLVDSKENDRSNRILFSKEVNGFRIILTWAAIPKDLDAHLVLPSGKEVNFDSKSDGDNTLDVDCNSGFGPETVTLKNLVSGTYMFYTQNFSNEALLSNSESKVILYKGKKTSSGFKSSYWRY
jgi:hypothetical protein